MLVYRFLNEQYTLEALQSGYLKLGRLAELNDPADCYPILENVPESAKIFAYGEYSKNYLQDFYQNFGLLCFSAVIKDPVVWSHYADSHRGIALGYDFDSVRDEKVFHRVNYDEKRPAVDYARAEVLRIAADQRDEYIKHIVRSGFTSKAPSWEYEKEYRRFISLEECRMVGRHYFFSITPKEIVLGLNCRLAAQDIIRALSPGKSGNPKIKRAHLDDLNHSLIVRDALSLGD
jgi:Protein of unknown function (DUF2971)